MLALLLLVPGLVYFSLRLALPGDASIPMVDFQWIQSGELAVRPVSPVPQGLQAGDIVTAIQGREIDQYIQGMFSPQESNRTRRQDPVHGAARRSNAPGGFP